MPENASLSTTTTTTTNADPPPPDRRTAATIMAVFTVLAVLAAVLRLSS